MAGRVACLLIRLVCGRELNSVFISVTIVTRPQEKKCERTVIATHTLQLTQFSNSSYIRLLLLLLFHFVFDVPLYDKFKSILCHATTTTATVMEQQQQ